MSRWAGLLVFALAVGVALGSQLAQRPGAQEVRSAPTEQKLSESDVDLYITVYSAMQGDHGLTIDDALSGRKISVTEFREIERRVQSDQRTVDRVRLALLNQAKSRNAWTIPGSAAVVPPKTEPEKPAE